MVGAAVFFAIGVALGVGCTAEFTAPNDERFVEEAALFEVFDEGGAGLIDIHRQAREVFVERAMVVPVAMVELDETHTAFGEAAGDETVAGEGAGLVHSGAVALESGGGFAGEVHEFRHTALHAVGHLELADPRLDLGVAAYRELLAVEVGDAVEHEAAAFAGEAGWIVEVEDRFAAGAELHALMLAREKTAAPQAREQPLAGAGFVDGDEHDEGRKVVVEAAEAVVGPGAHAGATGELAAALEKGDGGVVVDRLGVQRTDDANLVGDAARVREEIADDGAAFAAGFEGPLAGLDGEAGLRSDHAGDALAAADRVGEVFVEALAEDGFLVEEIEVGGAAGLEETDDAFRFRREMREAGEGAGGRGGDGERGRGGGRRGAGVAAEELGECGGAEAEAGLGEEISAGVELLVVVTRHGGSVLRDRFVEAENHAGDGGGGGEFGRGERGVDR